MDLVSDGELLRRLSKILCIDQSLLAQLTLRSDEAILIHSERKSYCEHCLIEELKAGLRPAYKRSWSLKWTAICHKHGVPLSTFDTRAIEDDPITNALTHLYIKDLEISIFNQEHSLRPARSIDLYKQIKTGRDAICLLAWIFQNWLEINLKNGAAKLQNGTTITYPLVIRIMDLIGSVAYRKIHKKSSYDSMLLFYLRRQNRPSLSTSSDITLDNILCGGLGEISAGDRIGLLAFTGSFLGVPCMMRLLTHLNRTIWVEGIHWDALNLIFEDEYYNFRPWILEHFNDDPPEVISLVSSLLSQESLLLNGNK